MLWKLFDMVIGGIQAFIFALLTVLYFAMAGAGHGDEHDEEDDHETPTKTDDKTPELRGLTTRSDPTRGNPTSAAPGAETRREEHMAAN